MSIKNWPGGVVRKTPVVPAGPYQNGAASGVWTLEQQAYWLKQGLWPVAGNAAPTAVFAGGTIQNGNTVNVMDYITIESTGNAVDFGDLVTNINSLAGCASSTRGLVGGGYDADSNKLNVIQYITIASAGNATDFGDLTGAYAPAELAAANSQTRGIFAGGNSSNATLNNSNLIQYVTIATTGNATSFGDLTLGRMNFAGCSSSVRGIFGGGYRNNDIWSNVIDYITIASTGNATDFGDLLETIMRVAACSSATRGVFSGGMNTGYSSVNVIAYITIASTGNATDFGDLITGTQSLAGASSSTRGVFGGGFTTDPINVIQFVTIATTGNATDFGDLTVARRDLAGCSNANGGVQ